MEIDSRTVMSDEVIALCQAKGILQFVPRIHAIIHKVYRGVEDIIFNSYEDPELPECVKLHVQVHLKSKPECVLDDEDRFYDQFFNIIPEEKQDLFVITYRVS